METYFLDNLNIIFADASAQPTRTPGAMILEKDPLLILLPHESTELVARSKSTSRGGIAASFTEGLESSGAQRRKSYTSSEMRRISYFRASASNFSRIGVDIVFALGFENVGVKYRTCL